MEVAVQAAGGLVVDADCPVPPALTVHPDLPPLQVHVSAAMMAGWRHPQAHRRLRRRAAQDRLRPAAKREGRPHDRVIGA